MKWLTRFLRPTVPTPGTRVRLSGGYDMKPQWLGSRESITGTLRAFIPGQNAEPAAVIEFDEPLISALGSGKFAVLELRYVRATWGRKETVHVELCEALPEERRWQERPKGVWVESHATYEVLA